MMSTGGSATAPKIRILIVDDLAQVREELEEVLQLTAGFDVIDTAADGLKAIQLAEELNPDIVLMDVEMPGLDGFDTAQKIKSRQLAKVVVMLSIHSRLENRHRVQETDVDAYIEKGEGVDTLIKTLRRVWQESLIASKVDS